MKNPVEYDSLLDIVIAVDFDGTCVTHEYPKVGRDIGAESVLSGKYLFSAFKEIPLRTLGLLARKHMRKYTLMMLL
jgi:hypothetical protein